MTDEEITKLAKAIAVAIWDEQERREAERQRAQTDRLERLPGTKALWDLREAEEELRLAERRRQGAEAPTRAAMVREEAQRVNAEAEAMEQFLSPG